MPTYPIRPVVLPHNLQGVANGRLPQTSLAPFLTGEHSLHPFATWHGTRLVNACKAATGIQLTYTYGGCYRTYTQQYNLFHSRYTPCSYATYITLASGKRKYWGANPINKYWKLNAGMAMAAVPGTSNHGWGLAIDVALGENSATCTPLTYNAINWLYINAPKYGFSWESQSEPWHIRYVLGDVHPQ